MWEPSFGIWNLFFGIFAPDVVKLVDTSDLGSDAVRCGGSSPSIRTNVETRHALSLPSIEKIWLQLQKKISVC